MGVNRQNVIPPAVLSFYINFISIKGLRHTKLKKKLCLFNLPMTITVERLMSNDYKIYIKLILTSKRGYNDLFQIPSSTSITDDIYPTFSDKLKCFLPAIQNKLHELAHKTDSM